MNGKELAVENPYEAVSRFWNVFLSITGFKYALRKFLHDLTDLQLPPNASCFEVGCGTGIITNTLLERFPSANAVATDIDENMLKQMRKEMELFGIEPGRIRTGIADVQTPNNILLYPDRKVQQLFPESFDIVIAGGVFEHNNIDIEIAIPAVTTLLKPGGLFLCIAMSEKIMAHVLGKLYQAHPISFEKYEEVFHRAGYCEIKKISIPPNYFPLNLSRMCFIARKK